MKRIYIVPALLLALAALSAPALAHESEDTALQEAITVQDLGIENPGILPTNPFYFVKEFGRGIKRLFTFNAISRVELELDVVNKKAAELKRVEEIAGASSEAIEKAIANYEENLVRLQERLQVLSETSANPRVDGLLDHLVDRAIKHQQLFEQLKGKHEALRERLEINQERLGKIAGEVPERFDNAEEFVERLEEVIEGQKEHLYKELVVINFVDRIEDDIVEVKIKQELSRIKDDQVLKFEGRIKAQGISREELSHVIEEFAGDELTVLEIVDELRERGTDGGVKSRLSEFRIEVLGKVREGGVSSERAAERIEDARERVEELQEEIASIDFEVPRSVRELSLRAEFNLSEAERFYKAGDYGAAYGQANSAAAVAHNALGLIERKDDVEEDKVEMRGQLDELMQLASNNGLDRGRNAHLFTLFDETEKLIVGAVSRDELRQVKAKLAEISVIIKQLVGAVSENEDKDENEDEGEDKDKKVCIEIYDPVCGVDGKTYGNECKAEVAGVAVGQDGECGALKPADGRPKIWKVEIKDRRFNPQEVVARKGDTVVWVNKDEARSWPATDVHPTHATYPGSGIEKCATVEKGTIFDACGSLEKGGEYKFTFTEKGAWRYHDHLRSFIIGSVVVQ